MSRFFDELFRRSERHVSDEELLRLMDGEISGAGARRMQRHLERCWGCRGRYEEVQATIFRFIDYRKQVAAPYLPPPPGGRDRFLHRLDEAILETKVSLPARLAHYLRSGMARAMSPVLASVFIVALASTALFLIWQRNAQTVSASELLEKAEAWDHSGTTDGRPGVIYQKIEIRTKTGAVERTVYRDAEGRRRPRLAGSDNSDQTLKRTLELGGINIQRPLSAADFRQWHDHLGNKKDNVRQNSGMLTLITSTDSTDVKEASITVRSTDFHPTARRLVLRDAEEIEISELNFAVLGWDQINTALLFEPEPGYSAPPAPDRMLHSPSPSPLLPTIAALDEAELRARLALNQANADTGEQLTISQSPSSVQITGIVEDELRKKQLQESLRGIPFVSVSLQTIEDLARRTRARDNHVSRVEEYSVVAQGSPLETYLAQKSVPHETAVALSQKLFNAALTIQKESLALSTLDKRFSTLERSRLDSNGTALLDELLKRHRNSLAAASADEKNLVEQYEPSTAMPGSIDSAANYTTEDLLEAAAQNKRLCDELLATGNRAQRPASQILPEMLQSLARLGTIAAAVDESPRPVSCSLHRAP
jgi:hypothetical protein